LRKELHHIGAEGDLVDDFVEQLLKETMADTDNQHDIKDWTETTTSLPDWNGRGDVIRSEFLSPAFKLKTGGAHFTLNPLYKVPLPKGDYVILNQTWEIISDTNSAAVPLTQMYNHHWLVGGDADPLDMCEGDYFFGGGAEYRNMDYSFPVGYGQGRVAATGQCGANLHFISTEDLAAQWEGFNNPDGNHGAAVKLAAECGFEPDRAIGPCNHWGDGSFLCCFTGSRARVNNPSNKTKTSFRLRGTFEYTRDFTSYRHLQMALLDVGGNSRDDHGQSLDLTAEWTVESHLNNEGVYTRCNDTVCTATRTQVIGDGSNFGYGLCSGEMLWGYMHMHAGGIMGSMSINGKEYCQSLPVVGTDPENPAGNEQGFLVKVTECVDHRLQGNKVRLEVGDVVTLTQHYDVDPASKRHFPMPGGKHGGIMALYFTVMDCDEGSWGEVYVRRNDTCVPVPSSKAQRVGQHWETKAQCQDGAEPSEDKNLAVQKSDTVVMETLAEPELGKMNLRWRDCGSSSKSVNFTALTPSQLHIGRKTHIKASGKLSRDVSAANLTVKMASGFAGLTLASFDGEVCSESHGMWTLEHLVHLKWKPLGCPLAPGDFSGELDIYVSPVIPKSFAHTTTTLVAHHEDEEIYCLEIVTTTGDIPTEFAEIMV